MNAALQDKDDIIVLSLFDYNDEKYGFTGDYGGADVDDDGVSTDDDGGDSQLRPRRVKQLLCLFSWPPGRLKRS